MKTTRVRNTVGVVGVVGAIAVAASQQGGQPPAGQPRPTFRAAANFVQVDVYPTADGRPVADLTKDEFDVLEDGVPQSVATFEHVSVRPGAPGTARRIRARRPRRTPWSPTRTTGCSSSSSTRTT